MKSAEHRPGTHATPYQTALADAGEKRLAAEAIMRHALDTGIYAHQSPELIALLMEVDMDQRIPQPLYLCVAGLLVWLHEIDSAHNHAPTPAATAITALP